MQEGAGFRDAQPEPNTACTCGTDLSGGLCPAQE